MSEQEKRYLAIIQFRADTPQAEIVRRVPGLQRLLSDLAEGKTELVFTGTQTFGVLLKTAATPFIISDALDRATVNGDKFVLIEVGNHAGNKGMGRVATWLQRQ